MEWIILDLVSKCRQQHDKHLDAGHSAAKLRGTSVHSGHISRVNIDIKKGRVRKID